MNSDAMPLIKLEVQHMKHAIVQHIGAAGSVLGKSMQEKIQQLIENYPWEEEVERIVNEELHNRIQSYFKYGNGAKAVKEAVRQGFDAVINKE